MWLKFVPCLAGSYWNPIEYSIVLDCLIRFAWFVQWSWLLWVGWCFLLGLCLMQRPCSRFFEMPFELLVEVSVVCRIVRSTGVSCPCFIFFHFLLYFIKFSFMFLLLLMFEFDNFLDGLFPCLLSLLIGHSKRSFCCMIGFLLWLVLLVLISPFVGVLLARNISTWVAFFRLSFSWVIFVTLTGGLGLELTLTLFFFVAVSFVLIVFWISFFSAFSSFVFSIKSLWSILLFLSLMILSQNVTIWLINVRENPFRLEYQLSISSWYF